MNNQQNKMTSNKGMVSNLHSTEINRTTGFAETPQKSVNHQISSSAVNNLNTTSLIVSNEEISKPMDIARDLIKDEIKFIESMEDYCKQHNFIGGVILLQERKSKLNPNLTEKKE